MLPKYCLPLFVWILLLWPGSADAQRHHRHTSASVYFSFNQYSLADSSKAQIDAAIYKQVIDDRSPISIIGYADFVGGESYNLSLSRKRADAVKDYLVASGFRAESITVIIGKGEVERPGMESNRGYAPDRRVDILRSADKPGIAKKPAQPVLRRDTTFPRITFNQTTDVAKLQPGQTLVLEKIFFYPGRHVIREASAPALEDLYTTLLENPGLEIRIEGHVCCIRRGIPDALDEGTGGMVLSTNRAIAIRQWLVNRGIDGGRLETKGFGKSMPVIQDERTEEEADKNRRVEIRILKK